MIETGLYEFLRDAATVNAIVSGRVYPVYLPQSPIYPAITFQRISGPRVRSLTGPSNLAHPRIQVDCWAATYNAAKELADAVRIAIDGYSGAMGDHTVYGAIVETDRDFYEPEALVARITLDIILWHDE